MTLEIKTITSWLVCCKVKYAHGVPRLGMQGLILQGNCWSDFNWLRSQDGKWKVRFVWIGMVVYGKWFWSGLLQEKLRSSTCPSWQRWVNACPGVGWRGYVGWLLVAHSSMVENNQCWPKWGLVHWVEVALLEWGCSSMLRSLWPVDGQSLWLKVCTFH